MKTEDPNIERDSLAYRKLIGWVVFVAIFILSLSVFVAYRTAPRFLESDYSRDTIFVKPDNTLQENIATPNPAFDSCISAIKAKYNSKHPKK